MPNLLVGLKYQSPNQKVETEQQLLQVFADLKEQYRRFNQTFRISTPTGSPVKDFEHFIRIVVQEGRSVLLTGSGDIGGLNVQNASLEYDLSSVGVLTKYWDIYQDGSCHSCHHHYYQPVGMEMEHACEIMNPMDWSHKCPKYDAFRKNSEGKPARKLDELVLEATK